MQKPLFIAKQGRHPRGVLGKIVARIMSRETAYENERAIEFLKVGDSDTVLDIGTGHGRSIHHLARLAHRGHVTSVDVSDVMLKLARKTNGSLIDKNLVSIEKGDSKDLPFSENVFNRVLAVHTLYFWDPVGAHLGEIWRVMVPGGRLVLAFRPAEDTEVVARFPSSIYCFHRVSTVERLLAKTGFAVIATHYVDNPGRSMVWVVAEKLIP